MNKQFFSILILCCCFQLNLCAQKKEEKLLQGTWESNGITLNGTFYAETDGTTILSFYKGGIFQDYLFGCNKDAFKAKCDTLYIRTGNWRLTKKMELKYYECFYNRGYFSEMEDSIFITSINDTALTLSASGKNPDYYYHYKRIAQQNQISVNIQRATINAQTPSSTDTLQDYKIFLVNSSDTTKKIVLENFNSPVQVDTKTFTPDSLREISKWYSGTINTLNDSTIGMTCRQENTHTYLVEENLNEGDVSTTYNGFETPFRQIKLQSISSIKYSSRRRASAFNTGAAFTWLTSFSMLIIAPLVSIKYADGGFNSKRYFLWTGVGLGVLGVSIPLMIFTQPKTYFIHLKGSFPSKKYWYFEKQYY